MRKFSSGSHSRSVENELPRNCECLSVFIRVPKAKLGNKVTHTLYCFGDKINHTDSAFWTGASQQSLEPPNKRGLRTISLLPEALCQTERCWSRSHLPQIALRIVWSTGHLQPASARLREASRPLLLCRATSSGLAVRYLVRYAAIETIGSHGTIPKYTCAMRSPRFE